MIIDLLMIFRVITELFTVVPLTILGRRQRLILEPSLSWVFYRKILNWPLKLTLGKWITETIAVEVVLTKRRNHWPSTLQQKRWWVVVVNDTIQGYFRRTQQESQTSSVTLSVTGSTDKWSVDLSGPRPIRTLTEPTDEVTGSCVIVSGWCRFSVPRLCTERFSGPSRGSESAGTLFESPGRWDGTNFRVDTDVEIHLWVWLPSVSKTKNYREEESKDVFPSQEWSVRVWVSEDRLPLR